jgi:large subunit GTPase 1
LEKISKKELGFNTIHQFNRGELLALLKHYSKNLKGRETNKERLMVGTVGFPNVGKSSVINVLCGIKRVGVANRPGKTKHFQTLNLDEDLCLCDCPGLVFPSFANSKAEMMTCGVLNIDTMRDYIGPVQLIMSRVPKEVLECQYKVKLPPRDSDKYTASIFLQLIASSKGWLTGSATPNEAIAARSIIRDYTTGKLLYV